MSTGDVIVLAIVVAAVGIAVYSLLRSRRKGGCCSGCGGNCGCCSTRAVTIEEKHE